jgi:hypothetical protein|tara:strand:- start:435 stop:707 length:273 start_codon:yes stop_codon:yes gene_type:complete
MEDDDDSKFKFSYVPAEIDEYGNFVVFGYPLIGGWLPKLAFESEVMYDDVFDPKEKKKYSIFIAEWFLVGYMVVYKIETTSMFEENKDDN